LHELEAEEYAEFFAQAYAIAQSWWDQIGDMAARDPDEFVTWYPGSEFDTATMPLTRRMWELQKIDDGLFGVWRRYARKYPERVAAV
jgi:hypothetical protein